ncbi:VCBS repeat-containing protein [Nostoc sp. CENA67]|uniref:VCBS repeat-containing protein n=1 Tax=Amazonocrinis nigriterrae CENA67 TaxID=2794033 RepID=A0A8J7LC36_9NOST|nr:VCBS repeat-containing protein [Amazonocrinis nigriterrae]MBH8566086.1 VCBS repeat-containing protein [Amazonocrinis nigriterrae CENA67]
MRTPADLQYLRSLPSERDRRPSLRSWLQVEALEERTTPASFRLDNLPIVAVNFGYDESAATASGYRSFVGLGGAYGGGEDPTVTVTFSLNGDSTSLTIVPDDPSEEGQEVSVTIEGSISASDSQNDSGAPAAQASGQVAFGTEDPFVMFTKVGVSGSSRESITRTVIVGKSYPLPISGSGSVIIVDSAGYHVLSFNLVVGISVGAVVPRDTVADDLKLNVPAPGSTDPFAGATLHYHNTTELLAAPKVEYWWANAPTLDAATVKYPAGPGKATLSHTLSPLTGPRQKTVTAGEVGQPGEDVRYLVAVIDLDGEPAAARGNNSAAAALSQSKDVAAGTVTYELRETLADDRVRVTYSTTGLTAADEYSITLVWSRDGTWENRLGKAYSFPDEDIKKTDGPHPVEINPAALTSRPQDAKFLLLVVDSDGTSLAGRIDEGANEANNITKLDKNLDVRPDIADISVDWLPQGAVADYTVRNRFWAPDGIIAQPFWDVSQATLAKPTSRLGGFVTFTADELDVPPSHAHSLRVNFAFSPQATLSEVKTDNNQAFVAIPAVKLQPIIEKIVTNHGGATAIRKAEYRVVVKLQSQAPFHMTYDLNWEEVAPQDVEAFTRSSGVTPINRAGTNRSIKLLAGKSTTVTLGDDQTAIGFNRTWDWLDPKLQGDQTPYDMMVGFLTHSSGQQFLDAYSAVREKVEKYKDAIPGSAEALEAFEGLGDTVREITELANAFAATEFPRAIKQQVVTYKVTPVAASTLGAPEMKPGNITLEVQDRNDGFLKAFQAGSLNTKYLIDSISKAFSNEDLAGLVTAVTRVDQNIAAVNKLYIDAVDPPDPDYQTPVGIPTAPTPVVDERLPAIYQQQLQVGRWITTLDAAARSAQDRWLGAAVAGDADAAAARLVDLSALATRLAAAYAAEVRLTALAELAVPAGPPSSELRDQIAAGGLPAEVAAAFAEVGASQDVTNAFKSVVSSNGLAAGGPTSLTVISSFMGALAAERAADALAQAIQIRTAELGQSVRPPTVGELAGVTAARNEIVALLSDSLPTDAVMLKVTAFLDCVRSLVLVTNNLGALQGSLSFGYGALFALPQLALTPADYADTVQSLAAAGRVSQPLASAVGAELAQAQAGFGAGDFDDAFAAIGRAQSLVAAATATEVSPEVASLLSGSLGLALSANNPPVATLPSNTPPRISGVANVDIRQDVTSGGIPLSVSDAETPFNQLFISATSSNPDLIPDSGVVFAPTGVSRQMVLVPNPGKTGIATITLTVRDAGGLTAATSFVVTVTPTPPAPMLIGGSADGSVSVYTPSTNTITTVQPFGSISTTVRTTSADVDGDGTADTIAVTGPGVPVRVTVLSGKDGSVLVQPFDPFGGDFRGGGYVAAADLDRDGRAEFAVTPDEGGGPRVTIFTMNPDGTRSTRANFFGIDDPSFRGGVRAAVGDVNGDGTPDVVVAAGFGGGPRTAIFTGQSALAGNPTRLVADFFAFPGSDAVNLRNGSFVAAGDITGDGFADLVFGGGPGGAPRVFVLSGALVVAGDVAGAQAAPVANFFVGGNLNDRGGARVAITNADGDGFADLAVGSGAGRPAKVRVYLGKDFGGNSEPAATDLDPFGGAVLADGVYVG